MAKQNKNNVKVEEQKLLKTNIERITLLRIAQDIQRWRTCVRQWESRERPDRTKSYELYKEIVDDDQLIAVTQKIVFRCTNHRIWWKVDGKRADKLHPLNVLATKGYFRDLVKYIIESWWWSHSLIMCNFLEANFNPMTDEGVELVHRPNVRPEFGDILVRQGQTKDAIEFRKPPYSNFLLEVGDRRSLGLLNACCPIILGKRQGIVVHLDFLERYGMPIPAVAYDPNNPSNRAEAEKAIATFGSNAGVVYPNGGSFSLHDSAKAGNSSAFLDKFRYNDDSISKIFLLGTMTTDSGASLSQSQTHQQGEDEAIWAYQLFVETVLNEKLTNILRMHGWQVEEDGAFGYGDTERLKKAAYADILAKVSAIADVPMSHVYEVFNIPEPTESDKVARNIPATTQQPDIETAKKKMSAEGAGRLNLPKADDHSCATHGIPYNKVSDLPSSLAFNPDKVTRQEKDLLANIWEGVTSTGKIPRTHFQELHSLLTSALDEGYPEPKADWNSPDHLRRSLLEANVQRFSAAKDLAMVQELNQLKNDAKDFKEFHEAAKPLLANYQEHWLKTEYDHAVSSSQNAAAYLRQLDDSDLYPFWEYQTVGDDRVRDSHAALDGMKFRLDDTDALRFYPPNGYNCRCEAVPTDDDGGRASTIDDAINGIGGEAWDIMVKRGFDTNPGDTLKVFAKNMEYLQSFDPNNLGFRSFLLPEFKDKANLPRLDLKPANSQQAKAWFESKRGNLGLDSSDAIRLADYRERPVELHGNLVADLVTKAQASLLSEIEKVLEKPDEVWMEEGNAFVRRYLKFFEGRAITLDVIFSKGNPERIKSLNLLDDNSGASIDAVRRGILAYFKK